MTLGSQFNTIVYFQDSGDIHKILPNRYIKSRKDLNFLMDMPETTGMRFFYVPGYFPLEKEDWIVKIGDGQRSPRLISRTGIDSELILAHYEAAWALGNYKNILFEFEGGMGDYIDQADAALEVRKEYPQKVIAVLIDQTRAEGLKLLLGFEDFKIITRHDLVAASSPKIQFSRINHLCGNYLPGGKIAAYSKIAGLDKTARRTPIISDSRNIDNARGMIQEKIGQEYEYVVMLHTMSGNTNTKCILPEHVTRLLTPLIDEKKIYFLHVGGAGEKTIDHPRIISLQGKLNWSEVINLGLCCDGCICIDSAILHIAQHIGLPALSFWGPTDPINILGHDRNVDCITTSLECGGCNLYDCPKKGCMENFDLMEVHKKLLNLKRGMKKWKIWNTMKSQNIMTTITGTHPEKNQDTQT